jgi:2-polyprenyl-3-methyl-5-hydroxy-6-metoxy-1,4-benzoquinol methylase
MEKCNICHSKLEKLTFIFSEYFKNFFKYLGICKSCGHLQIYKKYSLLEYKEINDQFFLNTYKIQDKDEKNKQIYQKRLDKFKRLMHDQKLDNIKVLDFGAGQGIFTDYLLNKSCLYYFTESNEYSIKKLKNKGGIQLETSFEEIKDIEKFINFFDLIILRHTLEHFILPNNWLTNFKKILNEKGKIYCIVPNCDSIDKLEFKAGFRTDFLRPVHISYFNNNNLKKILNLNGFKIIKNEINGELFALAENSKEKISNKFINDYQENKKKIKNLNSKNFIKDLKIIAVRILKYYVKKLINY